MSRDLVLFLVDIEKSSAKIARYTQGLERQEAMADEMRLDAILRNLHIIGEAVKNLPDEFRQRHPEVAWREIAGMRDFVAHAYFALDYDILWDAVQKDVPELGRQIREILKVENPSEPVTGCTPGSSGRL